MTQPGPTRCRIVVGIDGSPFSAAALTWALTQAELMNAQVHVIMCWHPPVAAYAGPCYPILDGELAPATRAVAEAQVAALLEEHSIDPGRVSIALEEGDAGACLVLASREAALLVVGSHGHHALVGALLGSVSSYCLAHAHCPVVIVRPEHPATHVSASRAPADA